MHEKKTVVVIDDRRYEVRKLPADVGSFILMRMMGAATTAAAQLAPNGSDAPTEPQKKPTGAEMVRMLVTAALMKGATFDEFRFIQNHALFAISREEGDAGFIPIMADPGRWAGNKLEEQVGSNHHLLMTLMMEVMIFNFADFFDQGGFSGSPEQTKAQQDGIR